MPHEYAGPDGPRNGRSSAPASSAPPSDRLRQQFYAVSDIRGMYPRVGDVQLRYLEKLGLVQTVARVKGDRYYRFADLAVVKQVSAALEAGQPLARVVRALEAERRGQLAFDFDVRGRTDATPARVVALDRSAARRGAAADPAAALASADPQTRLAATYFLEGARLDATRGSARRRPRRTARPSSSTRTSCRPSSTSPTSTTPATA